MIVVVLRADDFAQRTPVDAPVTLDGVPRRGEGARVLDMDIDLERLAVVDQAEPFGHVQLLGVGRLIIVDVSLGGDSDGVDDEGVAVVMARTALRSPSAARRD